MKMKRVLTGLFLLIGIEALGGVVYLLLLPADPKNAFLWGYSAARLTMAGWILAMNLVFMAAAGLTWRRYDRIDRGMKWLLGTQTRLWSAGFLLALMTIAAWIAVWLPAYRYGNKLLLYERLVPVLVWIGLSCGQGLLVFLVWRDVLNFRRFWQAVRSEKELWWLVAGGMSLFALVRVAATRLEFLTAHDAMQYNPPGAPVLPIQVLGSWLVGVGALVLAKLFLHRTLTARQGGFWKKIDLGIFIVIWMIAAMIWIQTPMQPTFFAPLQRPPDGVLFPYSDAALYDRTAEFALMGLGLRNGAYVDKPLYSAFLTMLHLIGGQNYDLITAMQAAVFALLPALIVLVGKATAQQPRRYCCSAAGYISWRECDFWGTLDSNCPCAAFVERDAYCIDVGFPDIFFGAMV